MIGFESKRSSKVCASTVLVKLELIANLKTFDMSLREGRLFPSRLCGDMQLPSIGFFASYFNASLPLRRSNQLVRKPLALTARSSFVSGTCPRTVGLEPTNRKEIRIAVISGRNIRIIPPKLFWRLRRILPLKRSGRTLSKSFVVFIKM